MKENAILIRQLDVLKVYVDFSSPDGIENAVNARRVSTIHTAKTQEISNLLGIHLVGYVDREGCDVNNELACHLSGYDYLGSFMLLCKTDNKFNNYGFTEEELECVYTYITTGKIVSSIKYSDEGSFFEKYGINPPLPDLFVEPKVYYREDFPYALLLRYDLSEIPMNKIEKVGESLFAFSSRLLESFKDVDGIHLSNDGKYYLNCKMESGFSFYNILIQVVDDEHDIYIRNAEEVIYKCFLENEEAMSPYYDDVDTAIEEAIDEDN